MKVSRVVRRERRGCFDTSGIDCLIVLIDKVHCEFLLAFEGILGMRIA